MNNSTEVSLTDLPRWNFTSGDELFPYHEIYTFHGKERKTKQYVEYEILSGIFEPVFYAVLIVGVACNLLVSLVLVRSAKLRKNISNFIVFNLCISEVIFRAAVTFFFVNFSRTSDRENGRCRSLIFIEHACLTAIFFFLAVIAMDRCENILSPLHRLTANKGFKHRLRLVCCVWVGAVLCGSPFLFFTASRSVEETNSLTNYSRNDFFTCGVKHTRSGQIGVTVSNFLAFVTPLIVMVMSYSKIVIFLRKERLAKTLQLSVPRSEKKAVFMSFTIISAYLLCWGPKLAVEVLETFDAINFQSIDLRVVSILLTVNLLHFSSSILHTAIYAFFNANFRTELRRMIYRAKPRSNTKLTPKLHITDLANKKLSCQPTKE